MENLLKPFLTDAVLYIWPVLEFKGSVQMLDKHLELRLSDPDLILFDNNENSPGDLWGRVTSF